VFGIGLGEFLALAVVAMIVLGPEKLPRYAADAARFLRSVRRMADAARADVRRELGPEFDGISISDLNPRTMVRRHLLEPIDLDDLDDESDRRRRTPDSRARDSRAGAEQRSRRPAQGGGSTSAVNGSKASGVAESGSATAGPAASGRAASGGASSGPAAAEDAPGGTVDDRPPYDPDTT
jgi:sec-independent protein translocase protein TatB